MSFDTSVRDTKEKLMAVLNESGLHIDIIDLLLETIYIRIHQQADAAYQMSLKEGGDVEDGAE